ncbi:aspartate aminotransferase family protein [Solirubrobacter ginsenosidimutans]|uniref:(S)-3-amino-2-methylpropionate transaminase n=1 Tax=Solirubrobacter ginsenosidimutans TaxID=490573 RepID=A0A9X3S3N9_9ACTN|nr:aspartate aminotransferase family protein [Solirubrobacter ginsenosidimutans]MDA0159718.1 aspartate aminotransferase family protein [Solirubrobacter ginsenosidimutans]
MTASQIQPETLLADRERWVARGVSAPAIVAVSAEGAHVQGADGVRYLDFAGGIGCQNLGHNPEAVVEAIHAQVDQYLHQCFMVAAYEPYVDVCRKLGELSPCRGTDQKSILFNSGAEAVENAVKIARAATGRPAIVSFDRGFHGRTLMTMTLTSKVKPYKKGFGPFAPEVYRAPAPYPYRGITSDDSIAALEQLFLAHVDPASVAAVILEPVQGEGGFIEMPADFPARLRELCDRHGILWIDDEVQAGVGRTGPVWAIEHYEDAQPDLLVSGKSLGGGLPLAAVTGPASVMDAVDPGGLGGTFGGNPVSCAAANVVLDAVPAMRAQSEALGVKLRAALEDMATRVEAIGEVRGLGPMLALEIVRDRTTKTPAPDVVGAAVAAARKEGLLLLACGLHGNVIRLLPPLTITDEELDRGLKILEAALV